MASKRVIEALAVAAEITGTELSRGAAKVMVADLGRYPEEQVLAALTRCRREVRGRLTLADVLARLDDGRPGPEEAWAMLPHDESKTVVWTSEMAEAFGVASKLFDDMVAARVAFIEVYKRLVREARDHSLPPRWIPSLGTDVAGRNHVLEEAVHRGRLSAQRAVQLGAALQSPSITDERTAERFALMQAAKTLKALTSGATNT